MPSGHFDYSLSLSEGVPVTSCHRWRADGGCPLLHTLAFQQESAWFSNQPFSIFYQSPLRSNFAARKQVRILLAREFLLLAQYQTYLLDKGQSLVIANLHHCQPHAILSLCLDCQRKVAEHLQVKTLMRWCRQWSLLFLLRFASGKWCLGMFYRYGVPSLLQFLHCSEAFCRGLVGFIHLKQM